jgi:YVTN family beta-propeller protein
MRADAARLLAVGGILLLGACLDPVDPGDAAVASIAVMFDGTNTADTINVRGTTRARAIAVAEAGYDLGRTDFAFTSSNEGVAIVEPTGVVRAVAPGKAVIRAMLPGGPAGEGEVVVVPSTVEYTIPVGQAPGEMAFSPDYTRLYVTIAPDSLAIVDALEFFRLSAVGLGMPGTGVAATADRVYVTHSTGDLVSVMPAGTNGAITRISVGSHPRGAAATAERAFIAVNGDRRIAIVENAQVSGSIALAGSPEHVAVARDGRRLFATMFAGLDGWRLVVANPATRDTLHSISLSSPPLAIATDLSGTRVYVLLLDGARAMVYVEGSNGRFTSAGSISVGPGATGIGARLQGTPVVVASGAPATVFVGNALDLSEQIDGLGSGRVAVRPDGVFAFIANVARGVLEVIGL